MLSRSVALPSSTTLMSGSPALSSRGFGRAPGYRSMSYTPLVSTNGDRSQSPVPAGRSWLPSGLGASSLGVQPGVVLRSGGLLQRASCGSISMLAATKSPFAETVAGRSASAAESNRDSSQAPVILASSMSMTSMDVAAGRRPLSSAGGSKPHLVSSGGIATNGDGPGEHAPDAPTTVGSTPGERRSGGEPIYNQSATSGGVLPSTMAPHERRPLSRDRIIHPPGGAQMSSSAASLSSKEFGAAWQAPMAPPSLQPRCRQEEPAASVGPSPSGSTLAKDENPLLDPLDPLILDGSRLTRLSDRPFQAMSSIARRAQESLLDRLSSPRRPSLAPHH